MFKQSKETAAKDRRQALIIAAVASVVLYAMWNMAVFNIIMIPLRLFVTYVHEAGHSIAAMITGGRVIRFIVSPDGSGLATTAGGVRSVVISGGYVGAALFGSLLFAIANRFSRWTRLLAGALGVFMIGFTLAFARPDESGALTAIVIGLLFGGVLVGLAWKAPRTVTLLVLDVLAISTALNAVLDVLYLLSALDARRGMVSNDAVAFSQQVTSGLLPAAVVALIWVLLAVALFGWAIWVGVWQPFRAEVDSAYSKMRGHS